MGVFFKRALVLSDFHFPFINNFLYRNILHLIKKEQFNEIILAGDFLDCYSISKFPSDPCRADDLQYELDEAAIALGSIRKLSKKSKITFIRGNHCDRIEKFLNSRAKALRNLRCLNLKELLELDKYNIHYEEHAYFLMPKLMIYHGSKTANMSSKAELDSLGVSGISGHVHRYNYYQKRNILGETLEWYSLGHLADITQLKYAKHFGHHWDNSFCVVEYNEDQFRVQMIRAFNNSFFYNGVKYENN